MWLIAVPLVITLIAISLRGSRWRGAALLASRIGYGAFVILSLLYFPARAGYRLSPPECEWTFGPALAVHSLTNFPHIILFFLFFMLTYAQLPGVRRAMLWSFIACLVMGLLVELGQGATGQGNCRMRDLIPDSAGALAGALLIWGGRQVRAFVRARGASDP